MPLTLFSLLAERMKEQKEANRETLAKCEVMQEEVHDIKEGIGNVEDGINDVKKGVDQTNQGMKDIKTGVDETKEEVRLAPAKRGSLTIHDEYVVHGSGGNNCPDRQRRTYVVAYRAREIVDAERLIGFTHSHNDEMNWDTFQDGESHRVNSEK